MARHLLLIAICFLFDQHDTEQLAAGSIGMQHVPAKMVSEHGQLNLPSNL